jgi:hypothetical protein
MTRTIGLVTMLAVVLIAPYRQLQEVGNGVEGADAAEDWVKQNYETVLNRLLPPGSPYEGGFPRDVRWSVTVRILPSLGPPESRLSLTKRYDGTVAASIIAPSHASITEQMKNLRKEHPDIGIDEALKEISLSTAFVSSNEDSRLIAIAHDYESLRFAPALPDYLFNDATKYEFWSESLWGAQMQVTLFGAPFGRERQPHPLLTWAEKLRHVLESHISEANAATTPTAKTGSQGTSTARGR